MRIGIDARELCGRPTGVGRHLAGLLGAWNASPRAERHTFLLFTPGSPAIPVSSRFSVRVLAGSGGTAWEQTTLANAANAENVDVFFAPAYTAPLRASAPVVLLVHDLSFLVHPEWFRWREGLRRRLFTKWSATRARSVLAVSESARREIIDVLGLPANRVRCVYPGISKPVTGEHTAERAPIVLFVGSVFNRRHLPDLIEAFKAVSRAHPDARLEIVGDNRTFPHQQLESIAAAEGLQDVVSIRSYVPDVVLADLYGRARAFAFLSEYEGFGHPPLEALSSGVPPLLLDTPVARETCLDAAMYVPPQVSAIANALNTLLADRAARERLLEAAPGVLARYSWANAAQQTLEVLEDAARS